MTPIVFSVSTTSILEYISSRFRLHTRVFKCPIGFDPYQSHQPRFRACTLDNVSWSLPTGTVKNTPSTRKHANTHILIIVGM